MEKHHAAPAQPSVEPTVNVSLLREPTPYKNPTRQHNRPPRPKNFGVISSEDYLKKVEDLEKAKKNLLEQKQERLRINKTIRAMKKKKEEEKKQQNENEQKKNQNLL